MTRNQLRQVANLNNTSEKLVKNLESLTSAMAAATGGGAAKATGKGKSPKDDNAEKTSVLLL